MPQIPAQNAATIAANYLSQITGINTGLTIEEVQLEGKFWLITIGHPEQSSVVFAPMMRAYKQIKIDSETGEVKGMTIRKI